MEKEIVVPVVIAVCFLAFMVSVMLNISPSDCAKLCAGRPIESYSPYGKCVCVKP